MTSLAVPEDADGARLDVALAALLDLSRSQAAGLVDAGLVRVDGRVRARSHRVRAGDRVEVTAPPEAAEERATPPAPPVRWRDDDLLVIAKPPGLVTHPGPGHPSGTLVQALEGAGIPLAPRGGPERPGIVHRLDRDTSGLMVVASSDRAHAGLVAALRERTVSRRYLALVQGTLPSERGRVDAPIARHPQDRKRFAVVEDGRPAVTHWLRLAVGELADTPVTLVACRLETGRTHQIRVHLAFAGASVVGDPTYGGRPAVAAAAGLARPFLHAAHLAFAHPVTGEPVAVAEPLPEDLVDALVAAGISVGSADPMGV